MRNENCDCDDFRCTQSFEKGNISRSWRRQRRERRKNTVMGYNTNSNWRKWYFCSCFCVFIVSYVFNFSSTKRIRSFYAYIYVFKFNAILAEFFLLSVQVIGKYARNCIGKIVENATRVYLWLCRVNRFSLSRNYSVSFFFLIETQDSIRLKNFLSVVSLLSLRSSFVRGVYFAVGDTSD